MWRLDNAFRRETQVSVSFSEFQEHCTDPICPTPEDGSIPCRYKLILHSICWNRPSPVWYVPFICWKCAELFPLQEWPAEPDSLHCLVLGCQISDGYKIVGSNNEIVFVCKPMASWYDEHLRAYELSHVSTFSITHDVFPFSLQEWRQAAYHTAATQCSELCTSKYCLEIQMSFLFQFKTSSCRNRDFWWVVVNDDDVRTLVFHERPNSIEELNTYMKEKLSAIIIVFTLFKVSPSQILSL